MKPIRIFALIIVIAISFSGCRARDSRSSSGPADPGATNSVSPGVLEGLESGAERAASDARENVSENDNALSAHDKAPEEIIEPEDSDLLNPRNNSVITESSVIAAMSTDFSQIGAHDAEKKGWGPGGPTDKQGRPDGAMIYQEKYGEYDAFFIGPSAGNKIYLTFDEGYENGYTAKILDTLKAKNVRAVFFLTLPYAQSEPQLIKRMIDEGHTVGNHSSAHKSFPDLPLMEAAKDIVRLHEYMKENFGYEMALFRPPMGEFSEQTLALAQSLGYKTVFWSFAYRDWLVDEQPLTAEALTKALSLSHPGAIYLLHAVSQTNAEILDEYIDNMRTKGYEFSEWNL